MNFFENQDQARRSTQQLLMLFVMAVIAMIATFYLAAVFFWWSTNRASSVDALGVGWWHPGLLGAIATITLLIIGTGTLTKTLSLRQGGSVVATSLGGVLVTPETRDAQERQLLNVVEEMAIASGIPVPSVYLLHRESGINAFAAGHTVNDAVIGVTRGCLEALSREELQGVIGHEFSHILNGDMRLNIKLMGVLNGILCIYLCGRFFAFRSSHSRLSDLRFDLVAIFIMAVGSIGLLLGRIIKSAVSRQREFLADASAVQFTRNPNGLCSALQKIGQSSARLRSPHAESASHMFFGNALGSSFTNWLATHPPLSVRIRRLGGAVEIPAQPQTASPSAGSVIGLHSGGDTLQISPERIVEQVGSVAPAHLAYAQGLLGQLPNSLKTSLKSPEQAASVVYALLLDEKKSIRQYQLQRLQQTESAVVIERVEQFADAIATLDPQSRLPLLELTVPALRQQSTEDRDRLHQNTQQLIQADGHLSLSEYTLQIILERRLQSQTAITETYTTLEQIWPDCVTLLSHVASVGHETPSDGIYALRCGLSRLPGGQKYPMPEQLSPNQFQQLDASLKRLAQAVPKLKKALVDACSYTVMLDNTVTSAEAELLRALVIALGCPLPPFLTARRYS